MTQLQNIYRAFSPTPLTAEQMSLYVPLEEARGEMDVVSRLARRIRLSEYPVKSGLGRSQRQR